jgi:FMN-dependent oxidoreductase (nitrilotriacetate monooxygenase family)
MESGQHEAAWRRPAAPGNSEFSIGHWIELARAAERAKFDSLFVADTPAVLPYGEHRTPGHLEPLILMAALATATERIGLIATASTEYGLPYLVARQLASLDHVSRGRAGWNIVTTANFAAAANFGITARTDHDDRYRRAAEFVQLLCRLWDSWEDEATLADKSSGRYADMSLIHPVRHRGEHFAVEGALNIRRPPQGRPVLVQAGSSQAGTAFAGRYAEAIFTAQPTFESARAFYADLKATVASAGREPDRVKILPGIVPILGSTEHEAQELARELDELRVPAMGLRQLGSILEVDASEFDLDKPVPDSALNGNGDQGWRSRVDIIRRLTETDGLTVRQVLGRLGAGRGHFTVVGSPEQVADVIVSWFENGAADGFNVMPATLPDGLSAFADHVVPLLRRRGLFRSDYEGTSLRDHYELAKPVNCFHTEAISVASGPASIPSDREDVRHGA